MPHFGMNHQDFMNNYTFSRLIMEIHRYIDENIENHGFLLSIFDENEKNHE